MPRGQRRGIGGRGEASAGMRAGGGAATDQLIKNIPSANKNLTEKFASCLAVDENRRKRGNRSDKFARTKKNSIGPQKFNRKMRFLLSWGWGPEEARHASACQQSTVKILNLNTRV